MSTDPEGQIYPRKQWPFPFAHPAQYWKYYYITQTNTLRCHISLIRSICKENIAKFIYLKNACLATSAKTNWTGISLSIILIWKFCVNLRVMQSTFPILCPYWEKEISHTDSWKWKSVQRAILARVRTIGTNHSNRLLQKQVDSCFLKEKHFYSHLLQQTREDQWKKHCACCADLFNKCWRVSCHKNCHVRNSLFIDSDLCCFPNCLLPKTAIALVDGILPTLSRGTVYIWSISAQQNYTIHSRKEEKIIEAIFWKPWTY